MGNQRCANGELDTSNYSSPMPAIGLYIVGSTLVCLLLILLDIYAGFRNRKRWLPCRFFSLNSVTLTLFGVATKLPVDLTTSMPSAQDQLSKLTGTTFICISMGFLMPSIGVTTRSECLSNMVALTIFVITVFINVCFQIHTGVIFSFTPEHIIVLCCMVLLLSELWLNTISIQNNKEYYANIIKYHCTKGRGSMVQRLKVSFLYAYDNDPQFDLCTKSISCKNFGLCIACAAVLVEAICRSFVSEKLEFCEGVSDYGWSMWGIIVSQTITILVGCLGISIRCLSMANHLNVDYGCVSCCICCSEASWLDNAFVKVIFPQFDIIFDLISLFLDATETLIKFTRRLMQAQKSYGRARFNKPEDKFEVEAMTVECKKLLEEKSEFRIYNWRLKKGVKELMKKSIEKKRLKAIVELLNRPPLSQESLIAFLATLKEYEVNPISVVVFARITTISIPTSLSQCIQDSFEEVFEIIEYIARKTITEVGFYEIDDLRGWWSGGRFKLLQMCKPEDSQSQSQLDLAIETIKRGRKKMLDMARLSTQMNTVASILGYLENKVYASIEDLYQEIEQITVSMLKELLSQLPSLICKEIIESSTEELGRKVKDGLKLLSKVEQLEPLILWSFPVGTTITSLVTNDEAIAAERRVVTQENNCIINTIITNANTNEIPNVQDQQIMLF
ncbi:hypothetical protein Syun_006155 [Stephania yunnanensis]|uniref:Uncharacterized protein n=1 Tax=Stephania yunnanensis TaxID=152371 RepID=A0AAP0KXQ3_9MAGN